MNGWLAVAAAVTAAGVVIAAVATGVVGVWVKHRLEVRKEGLAGVKKRCQVIQNELNAQKTDNTVRQNKINQLEEVKQTLADGLHETRYVGEQFFQRAKDLHPDDNWEEIGLEVGWPPVKLVDRWSVEW